MVSVDVDCLEEMVFEDEAASKRYIIENIHIKMLDHEFKHGTIKLEI